MLIVCSVEAEDGAVRSVGTRSGSPGVGVRVLVGRRVAEGVRDAVKVAVAVGISVAVLVGV
jgi:hypothetical protein